MEAADLKLDDILERARRTIPGCVAVGCIDTRLGMVLQARSEPTSNQDPMEMVSAAMGELFRSSNARSIDGIFQRLSDEAASDDPQLQQVFALSLSYIYVYQAITSSPDLVLATVCHANANLGMVLARAKSTLVELQQLSNSELGARP